MQAMRTKKKDNAEGEMEEGSKEDEEEEGKPVSHPFASLGFYRQLNYQSSVSPPAS